MTGPRRTTTGAVLEEMVTPALRHGGYALSRRVHVGTRPGGRRHIVDLVVEAAGSLFLVSLKWQQAAGTAEQKVPFEVMCLAERVMADDTYDAAYLVLGGNGWTLRDYYLSGALSEHLKFAGEVIIVDLESFVSIANSGAL